MPRGDRTGPQGMGPMTGRAAGYCAGYEVPGFANQMPGGGQGRGGGCGMAWRRGQGGRGYGRGMQEWTAPPAPYAPPPAVPPPVPVDERTALEQHRVALKAQLDYLNERLQALTGAEEEQAEE